MSDYETRGKAYYEAHKTEIMAKEKEKKRWLSYYYRNQDAVKERNRRRYYEKRGIEPPPRKGPVEIPDNSKLERLEAIVVELRDLVPGIMRPRPKKKAKKAEEVPASPDVPAPPPEVPTLSLV